MFVAVLHLSSVFADILIGRQVDTVWAVSKGERRALAGAAYLISRRTGPNGCGACLGELAGKVSPLGAFCAFRIGCVQTLSDS
jgi:hypothetical protein